jgi:hypothetical protein
MRGLALPLLMILLVGVPATAEEGYWPFGEPPLDRIQAATGVAIDQNWLDEARLATVRVNDAGTGSFISKQGLLLTNNHVVIDVLDNLSTAQRDLVLEGFRAKTAAEELRVPIEVLTLIHLEDVSARMHAAIAKASGTVDVADILYTEQAAIAEESTAASGQYSEVARHNDRFWLYRFKSYDDVRLVFSPSVKAAYFGGDDDRVTEPGTWLDMALLRVYDANENPLATPHYFPFDLTGANPDEAVFVNGFPWSTTRDLTESQAKLDKKLYIPAYTAKNKALRQAYDLYGALGADKKREILLPHWDAEGGEGAGEALLEDFKDPTFWAEIRKDDTRLKAAIAASPELTRQFGTLYADIDSTVAEKSRRYNEWTYRRLSGDSELATLASNMVLYANEAAKPEAERDYSLEDLYDEIISAEVNPQLDNFLISTALDLSQKVLGTNDAFVQDALQGLSPAALAKRIVTQTTLADPQARKALLDQGARAINASADPLIALARRIDTHVKEIDEWYAEKVEPAETTQRWLMARLRTAVDGLASPPDAAWSLRLSYGHVKGYQHQGRTVPPLSTFGEMFQLHDSDPTDEDFALDPQLAANRQAIDMTTPFNALAEVDIAGGNSGSAGINGQRRLVGLIYAENEFKMDGEYRYNTEKGRAMMVDARGILEALKNGYGMTRIAREISRDAAITVAAPPKKTAVTPAGNG